MTTLLKTASLIILFTNFYAHSMDSRLLLELPNEIVGGVIKYAAKDKIFEATKLLIQMSWLCKNFEQLGEPNNIKTILHLEQQELDAAFNEYAFYNNINACSEDGTTDEFTPFLKLLIAMDAQTNTVCKNLHECVRLTRNTYIAEYFILQHMTDINTQNKEGFTPLFQAIRSNKLNIVELLLQYGADMYIANDNGYTPTHWALLGDNDKCIKLLIHYRVDTTIEYSWGCNHAKMTIATWAKDNQNDEILKLVTPHDDTCVIF